MTDPRNGKHILAKLKTIGFTPFDLQTYGSLTFGDITPEVHCGRTTALRIDWSRMFITDRLNNVPIEMPNVAPISIFSSAQFSDFSAEHTNLSLVARYLEHWCVIPHLGPDSPVGHGTTLGLANTDSKPPEYTKVYPSTSTCPE
jgi:hypothetical protein